MFRPLICALFAIAITLPVAAQDGTAPIRGPETNLPLPRYVSMRAEEGNARRGPSTTHRIDWVFTQRHTPLRVVAEYEHWRKVVDRDGQGGWMHFALLSGTRYAYLETDVILRRRPNDAADGVAQVERGVLARVLECAPQWCRVRVERQLSCDATFCLRRSASYRGWLRKDTIWGVDPQEVFD